MIGPVGSGRPPTSADMEQSMTAQQVVVAALLCLSYLLTGNVCPAQTSFHGDFLAGQPSGTFDT